MRYLLEVCVDCLESARYAAENGADRLELCANLIIGGTSPSAALVRQVLKAVDIPVRVLLRPRFGDFCFSAAEQAELLEEIAVCRELGAAGVVYGALTEDGALNAPFLQQCAEAAQGMGKTLHRAFDVCKDPHAALEAAVQLGFDTILTSGQQPAAPDGLPLLKELVQQANGRLHILAGSGVNPDNIPLLAKEAAVTQFHFSGKHTVPSPMRFRREGVPMGLPLANEFERSYTDPAAVRRAREVLDALAEA